MEILVNNELMDVTLEGGERLGDIYRTLADWLGQAGLYPLQLRIDSRDLDLMDPEPWSGLDADGIGIMEIDAGSINRIRQDQLITVLDYINLLIGFGEGPGPGSGGQEIGEQFLDAMAEYPTVRASLPMLLRCSEEEFVRDFGSLDTSREALAGAGNAGAEFKDFITRLGQLRIILLDRLKELASPAIELENTARLMKGLIPQLEEAGISLQTGNAREAYTIVFRISELSAKLIRLISILSIDNPGASFLSFNEPLGKLDSIVKEISETIGQGDTVMLADLLEYDLQEMLDELVQQVAALKLEDA